MRSSIYIAYTLYPILNASNRKVIITFGEIMAVIVIPSTFLALAEDYSKTGKNIAE